MVMEWSLIYYIVIYTDGNGVITDILHCNIYSASGSGLAAPVLAGPVFLKVKILKASNRQSASVIFDLLGSLY